MTDEPDERSERRNAFVRSFLATALVAAAHVTAFAWLTSHGLSTEPPDSVLGNPIELDLLAVAPPEPSHEVAPAVPTAPQPTPGPTPTSEPTPTREPSTTLPPSPEPPPPTLETPAPPESSPPTPSPPEMQELVDCT
jgi:hypothetical protein